MSHTAISDAGSRQVAQCHALRWLNVGNRLSGLSIVQRDTPVLIYQRSGLVHAQHLTALRYLLLSHTQVGDQGLTYLRNFTLCSRST